MARHVVSQRQSQDGIRWHTMAWWILTSTHHFESLARLHVIEILAFGQSAVWCPERTRTALQMLEKLAAWCNFGAARSAGQKSLEKQLVRSLQHFIVLSAIIRPRCVNEIVFHLPDVLYFVVSGRDALLPNGDLRDHALRRFMASLSTSVHEFPIRLSGGLPTGCG